MKICVLGAGGLLGHMLIRTLGETNDVFGTTREHSNDRSPVARFLSHKKWISGVDAYKIDTVEAVFSQNQFDLVINCVGLIKQRDSQVSDIEMMRINAEFPHLLAEIANRHGTPVLHISTDCVFSGARGNYLESDAPDPIDSYGRSKLLGELNDAKNLTLRTSHIGRELSVKKSFIEWLLSQRGEKINGYSRAIYSGLTTLELSRLISKLIVTHKDLSGRYHVSSQPISKLEIINKLNELLDLCVTVIPDSSVVIDRSLNSLSFQQTTGITTPSWDTMLADFCKDQKNYE